ncbi:hypothetical protein O7627_33135 [Solwaraspora sp. WMMD1047]|uniref:hypothetical protein n=1 Tax=Solwaraspora sp. WMMD1047 TaxID=3016102 RepID=UPI002416AB61|nr:hypothetical protein [Solwaraspora sp. WMMD1047]MDG4834110.1 hypothetical protein [Solwaraspora sp. WMMD1047]
MTLPITSTIAARFPLVARKRPPAKPLDTRVNRLAVLAETAHREHDPAKASMVFNGAALVASDCADAYLARAWCHRHANLYLDQAPLNAHTARFALEPVVNLARLRIRAGDGDSAHALLTDLYEATINATDVNLDGLELHARHLPADPSERDQLVSWLRSVLLTDGTRALTLTGHWADAVAHVHRYDGIGPNLLDGRQVAVVAHLMQGDGPAAAAILHRSRIKDQWEKPVRDLLHLWSAAVAGDPRQGDHSALINQVPGVPPAPGLTVFRTRLVLTALDLTTDLPANIAASLIDRLVTDVLHGQDANPARELCNHPAVGPKHRETLRQLIEASGLDLHELPDPAHHILSSALDLAGTVIGSRGTAGLS